MRFNVIPNDLRNEIYKDYKREGIRRIVAYKELIQIDFFLEPVKVNDNRWAYGVLDKEVADLNHDLWFVRDLPANEDGEFGFAANLT